MTTFLSKFTKAFTYPWDVNQRIYGLYLLGALLLSSVFYVRRCLLGRKPVKDFRAWAGYLFNPRIFGHPSARLDYLLLVINPIILAVLTGLGVFSMTTIAIEVADGMDLLLGNTDPNWPTGMVTMLFTSTLFIADDFSRFLLHCLLHRIPFLWVFHKVHHSAEVLTPATVYRIHPVESLLFANRMLLTQGCVLGVFFYGFGMKLSAWDIAGANLFTFLFNFTGSNLRHSHIRLSYGPLFERLFISPAQHQLHHSNRPEHFNRNYGSFLAVWDALFGTLMPVHGQRRHGFGLGQTVPNPHTGIFQAYTLPFIEFAQLLGLGKVQVNLPDLPVVQKEV